MTQTDLSTPGPLDRPTALAAIARGQELLDAGQLPEAAAVFHRVTGFPDPEVTGAALAGLATALFRLDREAESLATWQQLAQLPQNSKTFEAWRQIAGIHVRDGNMNAARDAYRKAEKLAPASERAEIASRLGWLAKESGDRFESKRYFARSRDVEGAPIVTYGLIGVTAIVSLIILLGGDQASGLGDLLVLNKSGLAHGEYWRLLSPLLVHVTLLHLLFNMYALWYSGPLVERLYGPLPMLGMYILAGAAGSIGSFVIGGNASSAGASGAIFGLFGILFAASRAHHPMLDRRGQMLLGQMGSLIVINLIFGFVFPGIDISAHLGGLAAGLWLGFLLVPGAVPTLTTAWQRPTGAPPAPRSQTAQPMIRVIAVAVLLVAIIIGLVIGTAMRTGRTVTRGSGSAPDIAVLVAIRAATDKHAPTGTR